MLYSRHCGIVAPVPAPLARTFDISRLASRRRSYICATATKLQCREADGQNQQRDDDFESGHGVSSATIFHRWKR
jgi:hypothetical protein